MRPFLGVVAFFVLLFALIGSCGEDEAAPVRESSAPAAPRTPKVRYTKAGFIACNTRENLNLAMRIAVSRDQAALAQVVDGSTCVITRADVQVYVEHLGLGVVEFRPAGETQTAWTVAEAVLD